MNKQLEAMLYQRCLYDNEPAQWLKWVRDNVTEHHQDFVKAVLYKLEVTSTDTIPTLASRFHKIASDIMEAS